MGIYDKEKYGKIMEELKYCIKCQEVIAFPEITNNLCSNCFKKEKALLADIPNIATINKKRKEDNFIDPILKYVAKRNSVSLCIDMVVLGLMIYLIIIGIIKLI